MENEKYNRYREAQRIPTAARRIDSRVLVSTGW